MRSGAVCLVRLEYGLGSRTSGRRSEWERGEWNDVIRRWERGGNPADVTITEYV